MASHFSRFISHGRLLFLLVFGLVAIAKLTATNEGDLVEEAPYYGDWTNAHGDTLQITNASMKVNDVKALRYDDITEDSDGSFFVLQLKDSSESTYFEGKFLRLTFGKDPDRFTMSIYKTLPDALKKENELKHTEWTARLDEDEETDDGDDIE